MCGIAGIYNRQGISEDRSVIQRMAACLAHRGPDEEGFHFDRTTHLAARRLSIIDVAAGPQPVYSADKTLCVVFNGEIYNYQALRRELAAAGYCFQTSTDTEVLLAAYSLWGNRCVQRLKGMFAFCIRDRKKKKLLLARDRFGIKPLYIAQLPEGTFLFASEIKALLQHPRLERRLHPNAIRNVLAYGFNVAPYTFFKKVRQVLPGHFVVVRPDGVRQQQYWDIDLETPLIEASLDELSGQFVHEFQGAVQAGLAADVPVGAYLSGGIDSSAVPGMYARLSDTQVTTPTISFDGADYDELAYSRRVAGLFNTNNIEFRCAIEPDDIRRLIYHLENPIVSLLHLPLYLLSRKTREQGIKVVLSGDGADEILGGYDYFRLLKAVAFIERQDTPLRETILRKVFPQLSSAADVHAQFVHLKNFRRRFPFPHPAMPYQFQAFQPRGQLFSADFAHMVKKTPMDNPFFFDLERLSQRTLIDQALYLETKLRLLNLTLPLSDKMGMANSVEVRPLFLDHDFVNFLFRIPHHYKMQGLAEKLILKRSMRPLLPAEVCARRKQPLQPPGAWFIEAAGELISMYLAKDKINQAGYFNPSFVNFMLDEYRHAGRTDYAGVIIVLFFIQLWHDIFLA